MNRIARTASLTTALLIGSCEAVTEPEDRAVSFEVSGPGKDAIAIGESAQYRAVARDVAGNVVPGYRFTWTSSNPSVATIDSTGLAIGRSAGTTLISVTNRFSGAGLPLYVTPPVASVALVPPAARLLPGGHVSFQASPLDSAGAPVLYRTAIWSSTDSAVAAVVSLLFVAGAAQSIDGPRLIRVTAVTVAEQGETEETSDVLFVDQDLRGTAGNRIGEGTQQCTVGLNAVSMCLGTYVLGRGQIMVQSRRQRRDFYVLAVVGGTGIYSNASGSFVATTLSTNPRRERLLFSLEP